MTFAEKMRELHQAVRDLRTAVALTIAPWIRLHLTVGVAALQDDKRTAVTALLAIERYPYPPTTAIAGEALDRLEIDR